MPKKRLTAAERSILEDPARLKDAPAPGQKDEPANQGVPGKGSRGRRASNPLQVFRGTVKLVFSFYPLQFSAIILCIVLGAALSTLPSVFLQRTIEVVTRTWKTGDWSAAQPEVAKIVLTLIGVYVVVLAAQIAQAQLSAFVVQGTLMNMRNKMFEHMEKLPIRFFDQNKRGDVMSYYTNDVDTCSTWSSRWHPSWASCCGTPSP